MLDKLEVQQVAMDSAVVAALAKRHHLGPTWQFLAAAIGYYCPDQAPELESVAAQQR
jgi:hypothetical protein